MMLFATFPHDFSTVSATFPHFFDTILPLFRTFSRDACHFSAFFCWEYEEVLSRCAYGVVAHLIPVNAPSFVTFKPCKGD